MEANPIEVIMRIDFASSSGTEIVAHAEKVSNIVRCRDCEYYTAEDKWCRRLGLCGAFNEDGFCSYGERRDDG